MIAKTVTESADSIRLDAGELDHLAPLLDFIRDELAQLGWRARQRRAAKVGQSRLHSGIRERSVDLLAELVDNFGGRAVGSADAVPLARYVAWHEIRHWRNIRQGFRAHRCRHRECMQLADPDILGRPGRGGEYHLQLSTEQV